MEVKQLPELNQFYGSENFYQNPIARSVVYSDGIKYVFGECQAYWLLDIFLIWFSQFRKQVEFVSVELSHKLAEGLIIKITDGNENPLSPAERKIFNELGLFETDENHILFTHRNHTFPLISEEIAMFMENDTFYLASER